MMKKSRFPLIVVMLGTFFLYGSPANASTLFSFTISGGLSGSGQFAADFIGSQYNVTNVTGTAGAFNITGLDGYAGADNQLYFPGSPLFVSFAGLSFVTDEIRIWNIFNNAGSYAIINNIDCPGGTPDCAVAINLAVVEAVPLPAALPLFAAAVSAMGFFGWRKRRNKRTSAFAT